MERSIIILEGPTCSGKTNAGIKLAEAIGGEIISADSRQIFKYLDIGTAKPTKEELKKIKHHFISELNLDEDYNASIFENDALNRIEKIFQLGKVPIIVGGSGLYIRAIVDGIVETPAKDEDYRNKLIDEKEKFGKEYLFDKLKKIDPLSAEKMHSSYWKRVIRALEVYHLTGKSISQFHIEQVKDRKYKFEEYLFDWQRNVLYKNIDNRVEMMIESGLVKETENILDMGYSKKLNSLNTVGYKEMISYLDDDIPLDRAIELIKRNTRRFAKRQLTWFRKNESLNWISINSEKDIEDFIDKLIHKGLN